MKRSVYSNASQPFSKVSIEHKQLEIIEKQNSKSENLTTQETNPILNSDNTSNSAYTSYNVSQNLSNTIRSSLYLFLYTRTFGFFSGSKPSVQY